MTTTDVISPVIADGWWMHGDPGSGWWMGGMMIWMVIFWGAIVFGIVWLVRNNSERRVPREPEPLEILDRRFAEGTISFDEYRERTAILTDHQPRDTNPHIDPTPSRKRAKI